MNQQYKCSICGKQEVKLWRPYMNKSPLMCASCAEERQILIKNNKFRCIVDKNGMIPVYLESEMTNKLVINLDDFFDSIKLNSVTMIPAVLDKNNNYYSDILIPDDDYQWWKNLPTR